MDIRAKVESTSGQGGEMVVHGSSRWRNAASSLAGVRECDSSSPSIFSHCSLPTVRRLHSFISTSAGRVLSRYLLSVTPVTVVCASLPAPPSLASTGVEQRRRTNSAICAPALTSTRLSPIHDVTRHDHDKFARLTILRGLVNACQTLCCAASTAEKRPNRRH
jgi:hypothetical protein